MAERWGLAGQLARAAEFEPAFREMLDCAVLSSRRARTLAGAAYAKERRIVLNARLLEQGRESDRDSFTNVPMCSQIWRTIARAGMGSAGVK